MQTATVSETNSFESFDIRPPYLDRGFMESSSKWATTTSPTMSGRSMTTTSFPSTSCQSGRTTTSMQSPVSVGDLPATTGVMSVTGVTGIPNLVELDDAFNTLDPGQLLRESAAAATRAALMSDPPNRTANSLIKQPIKQQTNERRRQSFRLVDDLLQKIYHQSDPSYEDDNSDNNDETGSSDEALVGTDHHSSGARFSPKCALNRKGNWKPILFSLHI